jgi:hypothetical protein
MTYSTAPLHSLVEGLRIRNRGHQKKADALRRQYLTWEKLVSFYTSPELGVYVCPELETLTLNRGQTVLFFGSRLLS